MNKQIVVLAAGKGTRMKSEVPKVLVRLHKKPIIKHLLDEIEKIEQATKPVIVVGYKKELVQNELGSHYVYAEQENLSGTASAVLASKPHVSAEHIVVLCGDMPLIKAKSIEKLFKQHSENNSVLSMFTCIVPHFKKHYEHFLSFGRIVRDTKNNITNIKEYSDADEKEKAIKEVNPGIYIFNAQWLWENMEKIRNNNAQDEFYLTDIIAVAISQNKTVTSMKISPKEVIGINTPQQLAHAHTLVKEKAVTQFSHRKTFVFWFSYILGTMCIVALFAALGIVFSRLFNTITYQIITFFITAIFLSNILSKYYIIADRFLQKRRYYM